MNSKKFLFGILLAILSFILVLAGKLSATEWVTFVGVVGGLYVIVNVSEASNTK